MKNRFERCALVIAATLFVAVWAVSSPAFGERIREGGFLDQTGDVDTFTVDNPGENLQLTFEYLGPGAGYGLSVVDSYGLATEYTLNRGDIITLTGPGRYTLSVFSRSGSGGWTLFYDVETTPATGSGDETVPGGDEITIHGTISGPGDEYTFRIPAVSNYVEVAFDYPRGGASFHVRVVGKDKITILGDYDLERGELIQLFGGDNFYVTVYTTEGGGRFSATFNPQGAPVPEESILAQGILSGVWDTKEVIFEAELDNMSILFETPDVGTEFWVKIAGDHGKTLLGDFDLSESKIINLDEKGVYLITIYSRSGSGSYRAFYFGGEDLDRMARITPPPETLPTEPRIGPKFPPKIPGRMEHTVPEIAGLPPGSVHETGFLNGSGDFKTFIINAHIDYVEVTFTYPAGGVDFWVTILGEDGKSELGDFDLDNGEIIQLIGGGVFYVKIYSKEGAGEWSAVYNEGRTGPYGTGEGMSSSPGGYIY
ncbi:MAG: hypothetical protein JW885_11500 [Deltaproteobacteria bacterium]|nr:hypothetical protein [Candidatus Zymogenaceae bacterium]